MLRGFTTERAVQDWLNCYVVNCLCAQVVMSRGGYTSAIDIWSLGCIFGELLTRVVGLSLLPFMPC